MLDPQKTLEREALLKRIHELDAKIAQHERNLREGKDRLRVEEGLAQARRYLRAVKRVKRVRVPANQPNKFPT